MSGLLRKSGDKSLFCADLPFLCLTLGTHLLYRFVFWKNGILLSRLLLYVTARYDFQMLPCSPRNNYSCVSETRKLCKDMAQVTPSITFDIRTLITREDHNVFAQCHSIRFPHSVNQKQIKCRFL